MGSLIIIVVHGSPSEQGPSLADSATLAASRLVHAYKVPPSRPHRRDADRHHHTHTGSTPVVPWTALCLV